MYKRILVPIDGSSTANLALREAIALASRGGVTLRLVHVVDKLEFAPTVETARAMAERRKLLRKNGKSILERARADALKQGVVVETLLLESPGGRVAENIVEHAAKWSADLIAIGTHGRRGINRLMMGSDAEQVVRTSPVPVLVVRARKAA